MADSSGGELKKEEERSENGNSVTNHHATTKKDTINETLNHILPSKSGAGLHLQGIPQELA